MASGCIYQANSNFAFFTSTKVQILVLNASSPKSTKTDANAQMAGVRPLRCGSRDTLAGDCFTSTNVQILTLPRLPGLHQLTWFA